MLRSKNFLILVLAFASLTASAGPRVNNGGGGWVCHNLKTDKIDWLEVLDLVDVDWSARQAKAVTTGDEWALYQSKLDFIAKRVPRLQEILNASPVDLNKIWYPLDHAIEIIGDAAVANKPLPTSCPDGDVEFVQIADFLATGSLVIDQGLWNLPTFPTRHKAALLMHERLYFAFRNRFKDENSWRTQQVVHALFADKIDRRDIEYYLSENISSEGQDSLVALFPVHLRCQVSLMTADSEAKMLDSKTWPDVAQGSNLEVELQGLRFTLSTNEADGVPTKFAITDVASGMATTLDSGPLQTLFLRDQIATLTFENQRKNIRGYLECWNQKPISPAKSLSVH